MSNEPKDGGPAFPVKGGILFYYPKEMEEQLRDLEEGVRAKFDGMTLRDWFVGQALNGICAGLCASPEDNGDTRGGANHRISFTHAAKDAYTLADAMLAARSLSA